MSSSVATVMPEIGFDDEPISPVSRDDTVTNRKPRMTISSAPTMRAMMPVPPTYSGFASAIDDDEREAADEHDLHREVAVGAQHRRRAPPRRRGSPCRPSLQAVPDRRQRAEQADDAARRHRAGADVEDVGAADLRPGPCR